NGFAEETCVDVTQHCTVYEERCDPAVHDDWCSWTELYWTPGRNVYARGAEDAPRWPEFSPRSDEQATRHETYVLNLTSLAGPKRDAVEVSHADFTAHGVDDYVFVGEGVRAVPPAAVPVDTDRVDCG